MPKSRVLVEPRRTPSADECPQLVEESDSDNGDEYENAVNDDSENTDEEIIDSPSDEEENEDDYKDQDGEGGEEVDVNRDQAAVSVMPIDARTLLGGITYEKTKDDSLSYDLGNLLAIDQHPVDIESYRASKEEELLKMGRENLQLLVNQLFNLPTERLSTVVGAIAHLPPPTTTLPRFKPIPKPKPPTRWEKFAQLKGIQKRSRGRMEWDEALQEWRPRYGYKRVNDDSNDWVLPAKASDEAGTDPWAQRKKSKKERVEKQQRQQSRNRYEAEKSQNKGLVTSVGASSLPSISKYSANLALRKTELEKSIKQVRTATASIGKFDKQLDNEKPFKHKNPHKFEPIVGVDEKKKSMKVLDRMFAKEDIVNVRKAVSVQMTAEQTKNAAKNKLNMNKKKGKFGRKKQ